MPWKTVHEGDKWCVHKLDDDDMPMGDSLGCHDSEDEANEQVAALYANEDKDLKSPSNTEVWMAEAAKFLVGSEMALAAKQLEVVEPVVGVVAVNVMDEKGSTSVPALLTASGPTARAFVRSFVDDGPQAIKVLSQAVGGFPTTPGAIVPIALDYVTPPLKEQLAAARTLDKDLTGPLSFSLFVTIPTSALPGTEPTLTKAVLSPRKGFAAIVARSGNDDLSGDSSWHVEEYIGKNSGAQTNGSLVKETWSSSYVADLPNSAFLFIEPGCEAGNCRHLPYKNAGGAVDLPHLRNALSRLGQESTGKDWKGFNREAVKSKAERVLAEHGGGGESDEEKQLNGLLEKVREFVRQLLNKDKAAEQLLGEVAIYKGKGGKAQWVVRYSNNFRDDDSPADIIAADSHRRFNELVKQGLVPPPDLWVWHQPEWQIGKGLWNTYDETGFSVAGGELLPGTEEIFDAFARMDDVRVSHGMPRWLISRDPTRKEIITEHVTREVSLLPGWAAANPHTSYVMYEERDMAIPKEEKARLMEEFGLTAGFLSRLEAMNSRDAETAQAEGRESKEKDAPEAEAPVAEVENTEAVETTDKEAEVTEAPANYDGEILKSLQEMNSALEQTMKMVMVLADSQKAIAGTVAELQQRDETRIAEKARQTPIASLAEMMQKSVVGSPAAEVDGRTKLAKSGPEEAEADSAQRHVLGVPSFIDPWVYGSNGDTQRGGTQ